MSSPNDPPLPPQTPALSAADFPATEFLRTRRLRLRHFCYRDAYALQRLGRDPRVSARLIDHPVDTLAAACGLIELANRVYRERPGLGIWATEDARGRFLGFFSLMHEFGDDVEIGVRLLPSTWGRGYPLEGGAALCEHAFATLSLPRLIGVCTPENRSVPPLLARLGFLPDGEVEEFGKRGLRFALVRERWRGVLPRKSGTALQE